MDDDELLPARMINEFMYCPRLFYLEWVQGRFLDNDDTRVGRQLHRHVDQEGGSAPMPGDGELRSARSVTMSSPHRGVIAKFDVIEGDGDLVTPVDHKSGHPQPDGSPWPGDTAQVCAQGLILRDNGYRCERAEIYYSQTRRRVTVELTDDRIAETDRAISDARRTARQGRAPLPLVDSPKCVRCSLVGICLPDEVNSLLDRRGLTPRRLTPRDPDHRPVYVTEQGAFIGVRGARLEISRDNEELASIRLIDTAQIVVFGNIQISTQALNACFARGIPVLWMSSGGWLKGFAVGQPPKYAEIRRRQTAVHAQDGNDIAARMIAGKIANSRTILRRNSRADVTKTLAALKRLADQASRSESFETLRGIEGAAARLYFAEFPSMLSEEHAEFGREFSQLGRNRRPPRDPVNALLSFCYAMLAKDLVAVTLGVGLDPYLGVFHRTRHGRPALALDLAEEFRPLIADSVVIGVLNNGEVRPGDFVRRGASVALNDRGRRAVLRAYERRLETTIRHPVFGYTITYRRVLDVQARLLSAVLIGELSEYTPMVTR